jgi:hypothetical protein
MHAASRRSRLATTTKRALRKLSPWELSKHTFVVDSATPLRPASY